MNRMSGFRIKKWMQQCTCICIVILAVACGGNVMYDEVQSVNERGWGAEDHLRFTVPVNDTSKVFDILFHTRNASTYEYSNLWLFVSTSAPNGVSMTDTVEFILAEPSGKWLGKGLGAVNSILLPYKLNIKFPARGVYTFDIKQAMRQNKLNGIMDLGIRVEERL